MSFIRELAQKNARVLALLAAAAAFCPRPSVNLNDWAERKRVLLSKSSAEPGKYRVDRTPYNRAIGDALSPEDPCEIVVYLKGAQVGGSEVGNNWVGTIMDENPIPLMVVYPNLDLAKKFTKSRIDPMIQSTPSLYKKVFDRKEKKQSNTVLYKDFPGAILAVAGANSAASQRSMAYGAWYGDEIDGFPEDVEGEGDPVALGLRGLTTFQNGKAFLVSTPTSESSSRIEKNYLKTDQQRYNLPCPGCEEFQEVTWPKIKYDDDDATTVRMACEFCAEEFKEHSWKGDLTQGKWIARYPERSHKRKGFFVPGLLSPLGWLSWETCVERWLEAHGPPVDPLLLKPFMNHILGESWAERGEVPDWETLYRRREEYPIGVIPRGGIVLTAGADIQKNRIEVELMAMGRGRESWSVAYVVILGDPDDKTSSGPWAELKRILDTHYPVEGEDTFLPIRRMAVDCGYKSSLVYDFVRANPRAIAIHGRETLPMPIGQPRKADIKLGNGKRLKRGVQYWPIGTNFCKEMIYGNLRLKEPLPESGEPFPPGYCHFPQYEQEYFKQLTGEQVVARKVRGYLRPQWEKTRDRNEALDCRVYARAAASAEGVDRWRDKDWDHLESLIRTSNKTAPVKKKKKKKRRRPSYLDR